MRTCLILFRKLASASVCITICGFVSQFVGLRTLHWSVTVVSLGLTILMIFIRAWIRRGLAYSTDYMELDEGFEVAQIATLMDDHCREVSTHRIPHLTLPKRLGENEGSVKRWFIPTRLVTAMLSSVPGTQHLAIKGELV